MRIKIVFLSIIACILPSHNTYPSSPLFSPVHLPLYHERITTSPYSLLKAARYALNYYFKSKSRYERKLVKSALLEKNVISSSQAQETLNFLIKTIEEDHRAKKNEFRMLDPLFLKKHFTFIKWRSDQKEATKNGYHIEPNKIRLTSYAVFRCKGSPTKTKDYPHALYEITSKTFQNHHRTKHGKHTILQGLFEKESFTKHIKPLVWLSRQHLEQALMQGSTLVTTPDGKEHLYNVYKSNGFPYNKKIRRSWDQKKYWFFKEIKKNHSRRETRHCKLIQLGGTLFAGDVENIGLGKIIALRYYNCLTGKKELRLGVLADRGSAFSNNLYQLDLFAGIFNNRNQFNKFIRRFPDTVEAYILKKI